MSLDNSSEGVLPFKTEQVDPSLIQPISWAGTSHLHKPAAQDDCPSPFLPVMPAATPSFQPRPFPPPSLAGVPMEYVVNQLRNIAPYYWKRPETADCTIVIPVPHSRGAVIPPSLSGLFPLQSDTFTGMLDPSGRGRRATQPATNFIPQISFKLHVDYLSAHSRYLRGLFSGANPLDLIHSTSSPFNRLNIPADRMPRLLPGAPNHPVLFLPVPDPSSFHLLIHWIYFGHTDLVNDCLHQGVIQWEGIARNVEYLELSDEIKVFLGTWYSRWLDRDSKDQDRCGYDSDDDLDTLYSDVDDDGSSTASGIDDSEDEKEVWRGRSRAARPLSFQKLGT